MIPENEKFKNLFTLDKKKRNKMLKEFDKEIEFFEFFEPNKLFDGKHEGLPKLKPKEIRKLKYLMYSALMYSCNKFCEEYPEYDAIDSICTTTDILLNKEFRLGIYEDSEDEELDDEDEDYLNEIGQSMFNGGKGVIKHDNG